MGKAFVREIAHLFLAVGEGSALESIALKAVFVASAWLLQKSSRTSKNSDHIRLLDQHLRSWKDRNLLSLIDEGKAIQSHFRLQYPAVSDNLISRSFAKLMFEGKTKAALDLVSCRGHASVLHLDDAVNSTSTTRDVRDVLKTKHPPAQPLHIDCLLPGWKNPPPSHPIIFDSLNAAVIRSAALRLLVPLDWTLIAGVYVDCALLFKVLLESFVLLLLCLLAVCVLPFFPRHSIPLLSLPSDCTRQTTWCSLYWNLRSSQTNCC